MLEGFQVVEFATDVAGPSAAAGLAEWDAGVIIKVERRAGDPTRLLFDAEPEHRAVLFSNLKVA